MVNVDARKLSFFKHVIEQRAASESNSALYYWLKILANSGSYGLFVELNPNEVEPTKIKVFSGEESFETTSDVLEEPGKWFAPHIASLITSAGRLLLATLEKSITEAGGTYLFCDTDSAAIVATKRRQQIPMPDGAEPITALSRAEVQRIVDRFESLNPYDRELVPGSILKIHKLNWNQDKQPRQLFGFSIAAKRYSLYAKTGNDIQIVEPKAHGLGYFYPPKDSPKGWNHETPQWVFEAWDWIMRGVLGLKRTKPDWFDLPVMMKLTLSTPFHVLRRLEKGPLTRPYNFLMLPQICRFGCPANVDPNRFTLVTQFTSERDQWMASKCINIHEYDSRIMNSRMSTIPKGLCQRISSCCWSHIKIILRRRVLDQTGNPCESHTRGLLQRAHIHANWPPEYIGKESDRHWEEGDDPSLLDFKAIRYRRKEMVLATADSWKGSRIFRNQNLFDRGLNQHTLEKICRREPVRAIKLAMCMRILEEWRKSQMGFRSLR